MQNPFSRKLFTVLLAFLTWQKRHLTSAMTSQYMEDEGATGQFMNNYRKLKEQVLLDYPNASVSDGGYPPPAGSRLISGTRPYFEQYQLYAVETEVAILVTTNRIVEMEIEQQSLVLVVEETVSWKDPALNWANRYPQENISAEPTMNFKNTTVRASDPPMITSMLLNANKVWVPPVYAKNVLKEEVLRGRTEVYAWNTGSCMIKQTIQYTVPCTVNVKNFPFDIHNCTLVLSQPLHWHSRLKFVQIANATMKEEEGDRHVYSREGEHLLWELLHWENVITQNDDVREIDEFTYTLILRRRATFYFTVLVVPCIVLNLLSLSVFTLPVVDNGRMDFCLALILTYFVLIMIVVESVPPSGEEIPLLGLYIILSAVTVAKGFGMSILLVHIEKQRSKRKAMPQSVSQALEKCCGLSKKKIRAKIWLDSECAIVSRKQSEVRTNSVRDGNLRQPSQCSESVRYAAETLTLIEMYKWEYLGKLLNIVFCIINLVTHIVMPLCIFS